MLEINTCPSCGSDRVRRTWTGEFQGQRYSVPDLEYYECPRCGERVYNREAMRRIEARSPAFAKTVARQ